MTAISSTAKEPSRVALPSGDQMNVAHRLRYIRAMLLALVANTAAASSFRPPAFSRSASSNRIRRSSHRKNIGTCTSRKTCRPSVAKLSPMIALPTPDKARTKSAATPTSQRGAFTEENMQRLRHGYFACISYIDAQLVTGWDYLYDATGTLLEKDREQIVEVEQPHGN